jgi:hypothetical protein
MYGYDDVCFEPLTVPDGFTPEEYFEYSTRRDGTFDTFSEFNATCPGFY